jgi:hypothetical protein
MWSAVSKINYEKFEEKLNEINWNEKLDHLNDVDEMCEKFTKSFLKIALLLQLRYKTKVFI